MKSCRAAIALFAAVAGVACLESSALASLPVFAGAKFNITPGNGYVDANQVATAGSLITNDGYAVGNATWRTTSLANGGERPLVWTPKDWNSLAIGGVPASGYKAGHVYDVNSVHTSVGDSESYSAGGVNLGYRGARWSAIGAQQLQNLGQSTAGIANTHAYAVNEGGISVGSSSKWINNVFYGDRAVRWDADDVIIEELGALNAKASNSVVDAAAHDINNNGLVVGESDLYDVNSYLGSRAVKWNAAGNITPLGTLGIASDGYTIASAVGVDNAGVIAGVSNKYDASNIYVGKRAVRYAANSTTAIELGGLGGTDINGNTNAAVKSMNENGLIVGSSNRYLIAQYVGSRPVYWTTTGSTAATELPNLGTNGGVTNGVANAANADNVIAGSMQKYTNNVLNGDRAVIWFTKGTDTVLDLNTLLAVNSGWVLTEAVGISNTGFVSGSGVYDADGAGGTAAYERHFSMMVPQAGTYGRGDGNFDTSVNFDDLVILAQKYNAPNPSQSIYVADFNLDGITDFADLVILAQNYNSGPANLNSFNGDFAGDWALAQSLVPESTTLSLLVAAGMVRRRRR